MVTTSTPKGVCENEAKLSNTALKNIAEQLASGMNLSADAINYETLNLAAAKIEGRQSRLNQDSSSC